MAQRAFNLHNGNRKRSTATGSVQSMATVIAGVQWQKAFDIILQALVSNNDKKPVFLRVILRACFSHDTPC
jgi:hypothetical protein